MPGNVSLESMLREIAMPEAIRAVGLPGDLFADVAPKVLASWRQRAAVESPSHLRRRSPQTALTLLAALLAALLAECEREVTDALVDLLIATVHRIGARAERKVTNELVNAFKKVSGKENLLFAIAEASLAEPDGEVREVVYPAVRGGEQTLKELVHEYKTKGPVYRRTAQTTLKASCTNHYRRGLIGPLNVLSFRSNNAAHRPVVDAVELIKRYARAGNTTYYPLGEHVPQHRGTTGQWAELVHRADKRGRARTVRMVYEVVTFQALREQLRCKEVWVAGAGRWRDPDQDLPGDFEVRRTEHCGELRKPLDAGEFVADLRGEMAAALAALDADLPGLDWVEIAERKAGAIKFTAPEAAEEPGCGAAGRPRWPPTPPTSARGIKTCSPSGTRAAAGAGSWCTGTSSGARWWCTPRRCAPRPRRSRRWSRAPSGTAPPCRSRATMSTPTGRAKSDSASPGS